MSIDVRTTNRKLNELWVEKRISLLQTKDKRYVVFSDLHLGDGGPADDFRENETAMRAALSFYLENGYTLILLGDIEEFWQFDYETIIKRYDKSIYADIRKFGQERVFRVFGNHDSEWSGFKDPAVPELNFPGTAVEGIKMNDIKGKASLLLVHGHQGSLDADKNSWFSRFFVRTFKVVEPLAKFLGLYGEGSATKSQIPDDYETTFYKWAKKNKVILICGHSHRAIFASKSYSEQLQDDIYELQLKIKTSEDSDKIKYYLKKITEINRELAHEEMRGRKIDPAEKYKRPKPCYFNCGCGLYSDGATAIEIDNGSINLVKWSNKKKRTVFDQGTISEFLEVINEEN